MLRVVLGYALKVSISAGVVVAIAFQIALLCGVWNPHVDPIQTLRNIFSQRVRPDWLAIRQPDRIYQSGQPVGVVIGEVTEANGTLTFERIVGVDALERARPFEYQDREWRIVNVSTQTLLDMTIRPPASSLEGVSCEEVR